MIIIKIHKTSQKQPSNDRFCCYLKLNCQRVKFTWHNSHYLLIQSEIQWTFLLKFNCLHTCHSILLTLFRTIYWTVKKHIYSVIHSHALVSRFLSGSLTPLNNHSNPILIIKIKTTLKCIIVKLHFIHSFRTLSFYLRQIFL